MMNLLQYITGWRKLNNVKNFYILNIGIIFVMLNNRKYEKDN